MGKTNSIIPVAAVAACCALAVVSARGEAYEKFYLKNNVADNYIATVTNNAVWYKLYDKNGTKWAVLTGHAADVQRIETPASVAYQDVGYPVRALGNQCLGGWYWGRNDALCEVVLTNGVVEVEQAAISYCNALTNLLLGTSLRYFGDGVLQGNPNLKHVSFPEGLAQMGNSTFYNSHIETVDWPSTMEFVPDRTFNNSWLRAINFAGAGLRRIEFDAFSYSQIISIDIPNSVTNIERDAFSNCRQLTSIHLPTGLAKIAERTFSSCSSLASIEIPAGVTEIGGSVFYGCSALAALELPAGLTRITGNYAFESCSSLGSIRIPDGITELPYGSLSYCSSLTNVTFPAGMEVIGGYAFSHCEALKAIELPSVATNIGNGAFAYCKALESIIVPDGCAEIKTATFQDCTVLTTVTLPSTVKRINAQAFERCSSLSTINLPSGLEFIGGSAFSGCSSLVSINWPASLATIEGSAFSGCSLLTAAHIPEGVTSIGDGAFQYCPALSSITVASGNPSYTMREGLLCRKDGLSVVAAPGDLTELRIPDGVGEIRPYAFAGRTALTKIHIPISVTNLGNNAFQGCDAIADATVPGRWSMVTISYNAAQNALTNVTVLSGTEWLAERFCDGSSKLQCVTLPEGLREIRPQAFSSCSSLAAIDLPSSVTNIGTYAFNSCALVSVAIPDGVKKIPNGCFSYCRQLEAVAFSDELEEIGQNAFSNCEKLYDIALPSALRVLGNTAFRSCYALTDVIVPDGVTDIRESTFESCKKLWSVRLPEGITNIRERAFFYCESLSDFKMPGGLQALGNQAFIACRSLGSVEIPEGVEGIPEEAFDGCKGLMSVKLPSTLKYLGKMAFAECPLVPSFNLPEGLEFIGDRTFYGCKSVAKLAIPSTVTTIVTSPNTPFGNMTALEAIDVASANANYCSIGGVLYDKAQTQLLFVPYLCKALYIPAGVASVNTSLFSDRPNLKTITVDAENPSYAARDGVLYDKGLTQVLFCARAIEHVEIPDSCVNLSWSAFKECKNLRSVVVPQRFTPIRTFFDPSYRNFTSVTLKDDATAVPSDFCLNCSSLTEVNLPATVTNIAGSAFANCSSLQSFIVPDGVTNIGGHAFSGCSLLQDFVFGPNVTNVGQWAFYNCASLGYLELPPSVVSLGQNALATTAALTVLVDGPPPGGIGGAGLSSGGTVLRPRACSNEWASVSLPYGVTVADIPEEGVTWTADTTLDWPSQDHVHVHKGVIEADETWAADKTHVVYGWLTVSNNVTVTVEKGAVVKFCEGMGLLVRCGGRFVANGVTFTSVRDDDVGGDSDKDSGMNPPTADSYTIYGFIDGDDETRFRSRLYRYGTANLPDMTWTSGNVYWLYGDVTVPEGKTLTIEPGAIVKLGFYTKINVNGRLDVQGTRSSPVVFTSWCDDEFGGDTDGTGDSPDEQCWHSIRVSGADAQADIRHAVLRYGGGRQLGGHATYTYGSVNAYGGETTLEGCTFCDGYWGGIQMNGGHVVARNCLFTDLDGCAVYADGGDASIVNSVVFNCLGPAGNQVPSGSGNSVVFQNCIVSEVDGWENPAVGNIAYSHCCFDGTNDCSFAGHDGNIQMDPLFNDPAGGDFRIGDASPCVDAGSSVAPARDYWGQTRQNVSPNPTGQMNGNGRYPDIGLYEVIPLAGALDAPDLEAFDVSAPKTFGVGDTITVTYKVRNVSAENDAEGEILDRVDLVAENGTAFSCGTLRHHVSFPGGLKNVGMYSIQFAVPAMPIGQVTPRVTVNCDRDLFEGLMTQNNVAKGAESTLQVSEMTYASFLVGGTRTLLPGAAFSCHLVGGASVPANALIVVRTSPGADLTITTCAEQMPTETYRFSVSERMDDGIYFVTLPEGSPYITIQNNGTDAISFTTEEKGAGLVLFDQVSVITTLNATVSNPSRAAQQYADEGAVHTNKTRVHVPIRFWGNDFADDLSVCLSQSHGVAAPDELMVFSSHSAYANFDVTGLVPGLYDLVASREGATVRIARVMVYSPEGWLDAGFTDFPKHTFGQDFNFRILDFPKNLRTGHTYNITAYWKNLRNEEVDAPVLKVWSTYSAVRLDNSSAWADKFKFLAQSATRPVTRLKPLEEGYFTFEMMATWDSDKYVKPSSKKKAHASLGMSTSSKGGGGGVSVATNGRRVKFSNASSVPSHTSGAHAVHLSSYGDVRLDWETKTFESNNRPADMNDEIWNFLKARLKAEYGENQKEVERHYRLRVEQCALEVDPSAPVPVVSVDNMVKHDARRILGDDPVLRKLEVCIDVKREARGVPLEVGRTYNTGLGGRLSDGMFGRGWHSPLETRLVRETDSIAYVGIPGCQKTCYTRGDGGDATMDNALAPGRDRLEGRRLVYRDDSYLQFNEDGLLAGAYDVRGRGWSVTYEDGTNRIARIDHTDGAWLAFTYDGDVVTGVADDLGRTATYLYEDLDGKKMLVAATNALNHGATYSYHAADNTPASRSLSRIRQDGEPDLDFAWDDSGFIASITRGGQFVTEYVRPDERTVKVVEPGGAVSTYEIGVNNNVLSVTDAEGQKTRIEYDDEGNFPVAFELPTGKRVLLEYNGPGDVLSVASPGGGVTVCDYTLGGKLEKIVDPDGKVRKFAYNAYNEPHSENSPEGVSRYYSYDESGNLSSVMYEGQLRGFTLGYNASNELVSVAATNTDRRVTYIRDEKRRIQNVEDWKGESVSSTGLEYDERNRVRAFTANGHHRELTYDGEYGVSSILDYENGAESPFGERYTYDSLGRLVSVTSASDGTRYLRNIYDDGPDGTGRLKREVFGNGTSTAYEYDQRGRIISMTTQTSNGTRLSDYRIVYNEDGKISSITETVDGKTHAFGYDLDGQLVLAKYSNSAEQGFGYDAAGNMTGLIYSTTYDQETGNLLRLADSINGTTLCGYDEFGRLNGVTNSHLGIYWSCAYDPFGGRTSVTSSGVVTERVNMPGTNRLLDEYEGGVRVRHHVWANGRRIAVVRPDGVRYLHCDHLCSVRMVTDETGAVTGKAEFRAFGERASSSGADASLCGWVAALGVETDPTGFMFMGHRYYSVQLAKFISEDPLGIAGGDFNFRRYCFNDPVGFFDPLGLNSMDCLGLQAMKDVVDIASLALTGLAIAAMIAGGPLTVVVIGVAAVACAVTSAAISYEMKGGLDGSDAAGLAATAVSLAPGPVGWGGTAVSTALTVDPGDDPKHRYSRHYKRR